MRGKYIKARANQFFLRSLDEFGPMLQTHLYPEGVGVSWLNMPMLREDTSEEYQRTLVIFRIQKPIARCLFKPVGDSILRPLEVMFHLRFETISQQQSQVCWEMTLQHLGRAIDRIRKSIQSEVSE